MQPLENIVDCYDKVATRYATQFIDELSHKHLDRMLLKSFVSENRNKGQLIDVGCGPGHTTKFLYDYGMTELVGVDISPEMVKVAKNLNPHLHFEIGNMLDLTYSGGYFGSVVAFYAIVHFDYDQLRQAFYEIQRVLTEKGQFLFSFHVGKEILHLDHFLGHGVNIDFHFFEVNLITDLLATMGFKILDAIERKPYPNVEYPSRRAYIWAEK